MDVVAADSFNLNNLGAFSVEGDAVFVVRTEDDRLAILEPDAVVIANILGGEVEECLVIEDVAVLVDLCLLYTSPSPRDS